MKELVNRADSFLIDVRSPAEVAEVNVPGAENIPVNEIPENLDRLRNFGGSLVLFCRSGARSENAMQWLMQQGIVEVYNAGGYKDVLRLKDN